MPEDANEDKSSSAPLNQTAEPGDQPDTTSAAAPHVADTDTADGAQPGLTGNVDLNSADLVDEG